MLQNYPSYGQRASRYSLYVELLQAGRVIGKWLASFQIKNCESTRTPPPEAPRYKTVNLYLSATFRPHVFLITQVIT